MQAHGFASPLDRLATPARASRRRRHRPGPGSPDRMLEHRWSGTTLNGTAAEQAADPGRASPPAVTPFARCARWCSISVQHRRPPPAPRGYGGADRVVRDPRRPPKVLPPRLPTAPPKPVAMSAASTGAIVLQAAIDPLSRNRASMGNPPAAGRRRGLRAALLWQRQASGSVHVGGLMHPAVGRR